MEATKEEIRLARQRREVIGLPSPQIALIVPVQRPEPVVEAEQTGLRNCGSVGAVRTERAEDAGAPSHRDTRAHARSQRLAPSSGALAGRASLPPVLPVTSRRAAPPSSCPSYPAPGSVPPQPVGDSRAPLRAAGGGGPRRTSGTCCRGRHRAVRRGSRRR